MCVCVCAGVCGLAMGVHVCIHIGVKKWECLPLNMDRRSARGQSEAQGQLEELRDTEIDRNADRLSSLFFS